MQGWYYVESLKGQRRHDRVQTESQIATVDSCFDLVGSLQHRVASCEVFSLFDWSFNPLVLIYVGFCCINSFDGIANGGEWLGSFDFNLSIALDLSNSFPI